MSERDWRIFREDHAISTKGGKVPMPFRSWAEAPLPEPILRAVEKVGYLKPSPIQMAAIPIGVAQRDVIGIAETGSGKTCAFVLPMLAYIMRLPTMAGNEAVEALGPYAVVLSPTRELAQQTEEECGKFAQYLNYRVVSVVGGQSIEEQGFKLRQGCEIVIGTPGRIIDCLERRYTVLHQCNFVVLDEADRMIDYGFEPQVIGVMDAMPSSNLKPVNEEEELEADKIYRTTFMFSATMPNVVERLARKYMRNPAVVHIGSAGKAADLITQNVQMMRPDDKPAALEAALRAAGDTQVIVFVNTHKTCDYIGKVMERLGKPTCVLHGGKTQDAREYSIDGFRNKKYQVLIATDVAGRGIDVPDVGLVVNYQMPGTIEAYTHRIGRTGRAGKKVRQLQECRVCWLRVRVCADALARAAGRGDEFFDAGGQGCVLRPEAAADGERQRGAARAGAPRGQPQEAAEGAGLRAQHRELAGAGAGGRGTGRTTNQRRNKHERSGAALRCARGATSAMVCGAAPRACVRLQPAQPDAAARPEQRQRRAGGDPPAHAAKKTDRDPVCRSSVLRAACCRTPHCALQRDRARIQDCARHDDGGERKVNVTQRTTPPHASPTAPHPAPAAPGSHRGVSAAWAAAAPKMEAPPAPPFVLRDATVPLCVLGAAHQGALQAGADATGCVRVDIGVDAAGRIASLAPAGAQRRRARACACARRTSGSFALQLAAPASR
jgi:superfamily II DNA/RNA helicase